MSKFNFSTPATNAGFSFAPNTTNAFGAQQPPAANLTFGTGINTTPQQASLPFGATTNTAPTFSAATSIPSFGATQAQPQTFNAPAVSQFPAATSTFGVASGPPAFGVAASAAPNFGATSIAPAFGAQPTLQNVAGFGQAAAPLFAATTAPTQPTLKLGTVPTTSIAPSSGFNFSTPATIGGLNFGPTSVAASSTVAPAITSGFFGTKTTSSAFPSLNTTTPFNVASSTAGTLLGGTLAPAIPQPSAKVGLGGIDVNASQPRTIEGRGENARAKEAQLPKEIVTTVQALQQHIEQQKSISSDIARKSKNVSDELQSLNWYLAEISNCVETNYATVKSLRAETAAAVRQAEMAQRTQQTPAGLQFENTAPLQYFMELIQKYETDMITFRNQVELTEKHMRSLANPQSFSADDLKKGLHQIHESFIALAGRLHETHQKVEVQKEQYLNLRKHLLKDNTNVFAEEEKPVNKPLTFGPTSFSTMMNINLAASNRNTVAWPLSMAQKADNTAFGINQQPTATFNVGSGITPFANAFGTSSPASFNSGDGSFNLQKPPVGSKRNKH